MVYDGAVIFADERVCAEVEAVNREFYEAFECQDLAHMARIWAHDAHVRCVHPGWDVLEGWPAVYTSWEMIFEDAGDVEIQLERVQVRASAHVAWVTCVEHIVSESSMGPVHNEILATNVFERVDEGGPWRMVQHHASPFSSRVSVSPSAPHTPPESLN